MCNKLFSSCKCNIHTFNACILINIMHILHCYTQNYQYIVVNEIVIVWIYLLTISCLYNHHSNIERFCVSLRNTIKKV